MAAGAASSTRRCGTPRRSCSTASPICAPPARAPNDGLYYGRRGTPTQWALAEALTELEPGAAGTMLYPSGVAAVTTALLAVLKPGDELLMVDSAYEPTRAFCRGVLAPMGITTRFYDPLVGAGDRRTDRPGDARDLPRKPRQPDLRGAGRAGDRAPSRARAGSSRCSTIPGRRRCCSRRSRHGVDLVDPRLHQIYRRPFGCDARLGHGRAGALGGAAPHDAHRSAIASARTMPSSPAAGLRTLAVRLKAHGEGALAVARWLETRPEVARVLHPALPGCPGHEMFVRDFAGASGLFGFVLAGGDDAARTALIDGLAHFGIGYSWGGYREPRAAGRSRGAAHRDALAGGRAARPPAHRPGRSGRPDRRSGARGSIASARRSGADRCSLEESDVEAPSRGPQSLPLVLDGEIATGSPRPAAASPDAPARRGPPLAPPRRSALRPSPRCGGTAAARRRDRG